MKSVEEVLAIIKMDPVAAAKAMAALDAIDLQWLHDVCHLRADLAGVTLRCGDCGVGE